MFISQDFMWRHRLETTPLPQPVLLHNIDGSANEHGSIMEEVHTLLCFRQHSERAQFAVTNLGQQSVIIGHPWLSHHNPEVDWATQKVSMTCCPTDCNRQVLKPEPELPLKPGVGSVDSRTCPAIILILSPLGTQTWIEEQDSEERGESNVFSLCNRSIQSQKYKTKSTWCGPLPRSDKTLATLVLSI